MKKIASTFFMKKDGKIMVPDSTAVRVSLWRAMHVQFDDKPHVLKDEIGLKLINPPESWKDRPDMHPIGTKPFRASIVLRSRFVEDLVMTELTKKTKQYVILGSGLDTFAQRKPELSSELTIYEIDKSPTLEWKKRRLIEEGYSLGPNHEFVPVDFESHISWIDELKKTNFDFSKPSILSFLGVSMYLTLDAIKETLTKVSLLPKGSKFIMTFMLPLELVDEKDKFGYEMSLKGARASGTPFISFFSPKEMLDFARSLGFKDLEHFSTTDLAKTYLKGRSDGLWPSTGEEILVITL